VHSHIEELASVTIHSLQLWLQAPLPLLRKPCMVLRQLLSNVNNYINFPWDPAAGLKVREQAMPPGEGSSVTVVIVLCYNAISTGFNINNVHECFGEQLVMARRAVVLQMVQHKINKIDQYPAQPTKDIVCSVLLLQGCWLHWLLSSRRLQQSYTGHQRCSRAL
jgi:hypothetical protein